MKSKLQKKATALFIIREKLALDLSNEIYMHKEEAYEIIDFALQLTDKIPNSYEQLKSEIKSVSYTHLTLPTKA